MGGGYYGAIERSDKQFRRSLRIPGTAGALKGVRSGRDGALRGMRSTTHSK
jgi:hypothetical protein